MATPFTTRLCWPRWRLDGDRWAEIALSPDGLCGLGRSIANHPSGCAPEAPLVIAAPALGWVHVPRRLHMSTCTCTCTCDPEPVADPYAVGIADIGPR